MSACRRVGVSPSDAFPRVTGRVALPRDRRCASGKPFPVRVVGRVALPARPAFARFCKLDPSADLVPQLFVLSARLFCACSCFMDVQRRSRGSATLPNARERVSDVRYADTPRRPHADTSPLAWRPRLALFIVKHVFAFWRFVSGCNLG